MQDGAISGDEAGDWLREHFRDDPDPEVRITWRDEQPDPAAYARILEILFRPRADTSTP